jgi:hypothetical protein
MGGRRRSSQQLLAAARSSSEKLGDLILKRLDAPLPRRFSPFATPRHGSQLVLAYELKWRAVKGFDFRNPLCFGGRVVCPSFPPRFPLVPPLRTLTTRSRRHFHRYWRWR